MNKHNDQMQFVVFSKAYKSLLNDYVHITSKHNDHTEVILKLIPREYKIKKCSLVKRYYTNKLNRNKPFIQPNVYKSTSTEYIFYRETLDAIYCVLFHLFDFGYKIKNDNVNHFIDYHFNEICTIIKHKKDKLNQLMVHKPKNKFTMNMINNNQSDVLFMDKLHLYLKNMKVGISHINAIDSMLNKDEYDTDSLQYDIMNNVSNVMNVTNDMNHFKLMEQFTVDMQRNSYWFNTGFTFYYWNFYVQIMKK